ncbi:MAG: hypothetical protein KTR15_03275 [Phycisphaeraceae bacterium]|nr:hypothetical protein [Phycisphaeraceae bacterium]
MPDELLFPTSDDDLLISVYQKQGRTLDDLPYTDAFETLYTSMYGDEGNAPSRASVFHRLHNLRKAGKLPRMGRAHGERPRITPDQEALLAAKVEQAIGALSKRDQLLYTSAFEELCTAFNSEAGLELSRHDIWRLIAKLAK